jgi:predicted  nucleic acid-binding Zn-ribbon protein
MEIAEVYEKLETLQDILSEKIKMERDIQERPRDLNKQEEVLARYKKTFIDQHQEYEKVREKEMELRAHLTEAETLREKA